MSEDEFYSTYYRNSGIEKEIVFEVLKEIANATEIAATKILPTDRFDQQLRPVKGWEFGDGLAEVSWFLKDKMKKAGISEQAQLHTVDELIRYVAWLETQLDK